MNTQPFKSEDNFFPKIHPKQQKQDLHFLAAFKHCIYKANVKKPPKTCINFTLNPPTRFLLFQTFLFKVGGRDP